MPTAQQITDALDEAIEAALGEWDARQAVYLAEHGRYAQIVATHGADELPEDGQVRAATRADERPHYQDESLEDFGFNAAHLRVCIAVDQYLSPAGPGYVYRFSLKIAGQVWRRSINRGPENYRARAWEVDPAEAE